MELSAEVREYLKLLIELIRIVAWPIFGIVILTRFKDVISGALARSKDIVIKVAGNEIHLTAVEVSDALSDVFNEIDTILKSHLTIEERRLFLKILDLPKWTRVEDLFPNFTRDSAELKMLRALRGVYFIRPLEGGTWQADKRIEVTNLGKIVAEHKKKELAAGL